VEEVDQSQKPHVQIHLVELLSVFKKPDSGPCKAFFRMWYFDLVTKSCQPFVYGGCSGNDNRFKTIEDCQNMCQKEQTTLRPAGNPCDTVRCAACTECTVDNSGSPTCTPITPPPASCLKIGNLCDRLRCPACTECKVDNSGIVTCKKITPPPASCCKGGNCQTPTDPCALMFCAECTQCVATGGEASCVADPKCTPSGPNRDFCSTNPCPKCYKCKSQCRDSDKDCHNFSCTWNPSAGC